jgi:hypothetical protein
MIKDYDAFIAHLKRKGRLKLLPRVLRELHIDEAQAKKIAPRVETAVENPSLVLGYRKFENYTLTDNTGKSALINIYKKIIAN